MVIEGELQDEQWCSVYGYETPPVEHACSIGVCFNPYRDGMELRGTLEERLTRAEALRKEIRDDNS